jgi:hypothetical protein
MKNKKLLLLLIILLPSLMWTILELSTINTSKLPHYGPKKVVDHDSVFYTTTSTFKTLTANNTLAAISLDTTRYPLFVACFIQEKYKKDDYRLAGLSEYAQYKREKIKEIPFVIVTPCDGDSLCFREFEKMTVDNPNIRNLFWNTASYDSLNLSFFKEKPYYVDYSYLVLVDSKRTIRGYYDARYVSEIKRLIEEYQHLRLKEEKKTLLNTNKIESH